jgi:hypothetical protein
MPSLSHPLQFVLVAVAGWMNQRQRDVIECLQEENRVLREQLGASLSLGVCASRTISADGSPR